jgi:glyoxylase-like metal-dependent hydrolase (beta-lactamase superfamily II)
MQSLLDIGVRPDDVDTVVISRAHPDHVGGLLKNGAPRFSNALHLLARAEWNFWMSAECARQPRTQRGALVDVPARSKSLTFALAELVEQHVHVADRLEAEALEDRTGHRPALRN